MPYGITGLRRIAIIPLGCLVLASCNAATTALNKSNLDVQTHMSESIFLEPVPEDKKTIYVGVRNTSDLSNLSLKPAIVQKLQERGYTIMTDPRKAHYIVQLNVLQAGPVDPKRKDAFLASGYGSTLDALAVGAAAGGITQFATGNTGAAVGVGLGIAAASFLADQLVKDVYYTVVTDIQISERPARGGTVREVTSTQRASGSTAGQSQYSQGAGASEGVSNFALSGSSNSTNRYQTVETSSDFIKYNVRDVAYANQMNLKVEQAVPVLIDHLSNSVANLFE